MTNLPPLPALFLACCAGCASIAPLPFRALSTEAPAAPRAEPDVSTAKRGVPRIGAPGGSGAGARSVTLPQSGKETVGGLPAGSGNSGRRG
jgi:hypothetical protein